VCSDSLWRLRLHARKIGMMRGYIILTRPDGRVLSGNLEEQVTGGVISVSSIVRNRIWRSKGEGVHVFPSLKRMQRAVIVGVGEITTG
jgi:hypothetical protein